MERERETDRPRKRDGERERQIERGRAGAMNTQKRQDDNEAASLRCCGTLNSKPTHWRSFSIIDAFSIVFSTLVPTLILIPKKTPTNLHKVWFCRRGWDPIRRSSV